MWALDKLIVSLSAAKVFLGWQSCLKKLILLKSRYEGCLYSARKVGIVKGILVGCSLGGMWFGNFAMVGLANWYGTKLSTSGTGTTGGDVIFVSKVAIPVISDAHGEEREGYDISGCICMSARTRDSKTIDPTSVLSEIILVRIRICTQIIYFRIIYHCEIGKICHAVKRAL